MIPYKIVRKKTDAVMAYVLDSGDVEVHMPINAPEQAAEDVVNQYLPDIEKQIKMRLKTIEVKNSVNYSFRPMLFGERYPIVRRAGDVCEFSSGDRCFYVIPGLRQYQLKNFLKQIYTQIGSVVFAKQMKELSERMGVKYGHFQIFHLASPFGSCTNKGELIELSWALAMTDEEFVKSTILHELAHIKYDDHYSPEFISFVKEFCPGYNDIVARNCDYEIMLRADGWIAFGESAKQRKNKRPGKPYPYNLICAILEGGEYVGGLSQDELIAKIDSVILDLSKTYVRNKHIPARMQSIIQLYYGDGLSHQKIGEMFGISAGRVGQVRRRVLRLLRHPSRGDWLY